MPYGPYLLLKRLAVGGMAELYLAKDTRSNRMVVLKRILPYLAEEVEFLKMFLDEARIAAQLHHPNIVEVFELGRLDGSTFISMEWVDGIDLRKVLLKEQERESPIPPGIGAWVIARLCEGLHHAHQRPGTDGKPLGIIHRDVSPQNVMVSYRGDVKLVDFGIAKATAWMSRSKPGVIKGKFLYLAPEQLTQDRLDHRADLFALGTLLYELTVGKSPFYRNTTEAVIYSIRMEDPDPPHTVVPGYPISLSRIIMRCLEKDRDKRYQSAEEIRAALDGFIQVEAPTTKDDVGQYMADLFGDDDERTSVYVPPNAQTQAQPTIPAPPLPKKKLQKLGDDDDDRTVSIPGAVSPRKAAEKPGPPVREEPQITEPIKPKAGRDAIATAPFQAPSISAPTLPPIDPSFEPERTNIGRSEPTLAPVLEKDSMEFGPTRISLSGPTEMKTGDVVAFLEPTGEHPPINDVPSDPSVSTVSQPPPQKLLVPPTRRPPPPIPDDVTGPTRDPRERDDRTANQLPIPQNPGPQRPSRPRRQTSTQQKRAKESFDIEDHIATVDMASFEDSAVTRNRRVAVGFIIALGVIAVGLLTWAFWPSSAKPKPVQKPVAEKPKAVEPVQSPPPPSIVKVTFRGQAGTKVTVAGTAIALGAAVELPPGPVGVRYVCPPKKKQKPRTLEISPDIPASRDGVTIDVPCL
ncbi:MAG: protein kinase [Archangiaceae bacterium]|nr:protein kinase [Archangiaceae bacterium]